MNPIPLVKEFGKTEQKPVAPVSGLAGVTYLKSRSDNMHKKASVSSKHINAYLHKLSDEKKKELMHKVKVKRSHFYNGTSAVAAGMGAGAAMDHNSKREK